MRNFEDFISKSIKHKFILLMIGLAIGILIYLIFFQGVDMKEKKINIKQFILKPEYLICMCAEESQAAILDAEDDSFKVQIKFNSTEIAAVSWFSRDIYDHPRLAYKTKIDLRKVKLKFDVRFTNIAQLDAAEPPGMTIVDNNDVDYYVRLYNYATYSAPWWEVEIDFATVKAGWGADQDIPTNNVKEVKLTFIPTSTPVEALAEYQNWEVPGGYLRNEDIFVPVSSCYIATSYGDLYHYSPQRVIKNIEIAGFEGEINHYLGTAQFCERVWSGSEWIIDETKDFNIAARKWHESFWTYAHQKGYKIVNSISFELNKPPSGWAQIAYDYEEATTGWGSKVVCWFVSDVAAYLKKIFLKTAEYLNGVSVPIYLQIGEPWYWVQGVKPCFYNADLKNLFYAETGRYLHEWQDYKDDYETWIADLHWLRDKMGDFCQEIRDYVKATYSGAKLEILLYTPATLGSKKVDGTPSMIVIVNFPETDWSASEFDYFKIENYEYVTDGDFEAVRKDFKLIERLGYDNTNGYYMSGYVAIYNKQEWKYVRRAAQMAEKSEIFKGIFVWSLNQIIEGDISFILQDYWD